MKFGIMFFSDDERPGADNQYELVMESARFADEHEFTGVWLPERHFSRLGCLYPNPAVLHAAMAQGTRNIRLRAGSVVLPLHNPIRVAEEWAMVDNLSGGRVEIAFASGWHPQDFAFFPDKYASRRQDLFSDIDTVRRLWAGEQQAVLDGNGNAVSIRTYPTPVQARLPVWVTAAVNPDTFVRAGEIGADLLTHLFTQEVAELGRNIDRYRQARADNGHDPDTGTVAVMLHTFVGNDLDTVRDQVHDPYCAYLRNNSDTLLKGLAQNRGTDIDVDRLSDAESEELIEFVFERFFNERALMGTPDTCAPLVNALGAVGVDEIACLLDFGPEPDAILANLDHLDTLREQCRGDVARTVTHEPVTNFANAVAQPLPQAGSLQDVRRRCRESIDVDTFYQSIAAAGGDWGPGFKAITGLWRGDNEAVASVELPQDYQSETNRYGMHPILWDNCFELLGALVLDDLMRESDSFVLLQQGYRRVRMHAPAQQRVWSHFTGTRTCDSTGVFEGDVRILDDNGRLIAEVSGLRCKQLVLDKPDIPDTRPGTANRTASGICGLPEYLAAPPTGREAILEAGIAAHVESMLGIRPDQLDRQKSLIDMGLDSILAIGLRNSIETGFGLTIPIVRFLQGMTTEEVTDEVRRHLQTGQREHAQTAQAEEELVI